MKKWIVIAVLAAAGLYYYFVWNKKPAKKITDTAAPVAEEDSAPSLGGGGGFISGPDSTANSGVAATAPATVPVSVIPNPNFQSVPVFTLRGVTNIINPTNPGIGGVTNTNPVMPNANTGNLAPGNPRYHIYGTQSPLTPHL